jgi:hypothetical protein
MRTFSILSILIALAAAGILWKMLLDNRTPDRLPDPAEYAEMPVDQREEEYASAECSENDQGSSECEPEPVSAEQGEMEQQRGQAHDVMMESFDKKYDKYKGQINGR